MTETTMNGPSSPRVFVVNKSNHDFSKAEKYGRLVFLSDGPIQRFAINSMARKFMNALKHSGPEDYILLSGLNVMNSVACSCFAARHRRLNLLLFKGDRYYVRNLSFEDDQGDTDEPARD